MRVAVVAGGNLRRVRGRRVWSAVGATGLGESYDRRTALALACTWRVGVRFSEAPALAHRFNKSINNHPTNDNGG